MNRRNCVLAAAFVAAVVSYAAVKPGTGAVDSTRYQQSVKSLAGPEMKGRATGSKEMEKAASWIAKQFKDYGIPPAGGKSYFQRLEVTTNASLGKGNELGYALNANGKKTQLAFQQDFQPFNFSGNGKASGAAVFAGYGITAPEYNYDDYAGVDVKGKIVLLLRHEPQEFDEKSVFAGKAYTMHAQAQNKAVNAKFHGAKAVIFVNDVSNHTDSDTLDKFSRNVGPNSPDVPFVQIRGEVADAWLKTAGKNLKDWIAGVDKDLKPASLELPHLTLELQVNVERERKQVPNVWAYLAGATDEYIIAGAHYDHLGMGEQSSMTPDQAGKAIHPGADDNASGTAGLLELAAYFAGQPKLKRGVLFLAFAGEELGLLGSNYYVNHPALPLEKAVAMINMDMIGRIRDKRVFVGGVGTGSTFKALLDELKAKSRLNLDFSEQGGYGSSDHFSFTTKQVPVLFFFSGLHSDYHKPSDTWEKINQDSAAELLKLVAETGTRLMTAAERPKFIKVAENRPVASASTSGGYGAYFGSVPDMGESKEGFRISDVRDGSPAQKAGLKGGDLIVEFDGKPISNLYDFTYALRSKKPGDQVTLKYKRNGQVFDTKATLEVRR